MKKIFLITFAWAFCCTPLFAQDIDWQTDFARAQKLASEQDKMILLHFGAEWCRPCKTLESFVFTNMVVQKAVFENVIPVKIDVDLHPDKVRQYGVRGIPFDVVITPNGRVISERKSPTDASAYARMIEGLDNALPGLSKTKEMTDKQVALLKEKLQERKPLVENNDFRPSGEFTPAKPSHSQPSVSDEGFGLARKQASIVNPFQDRSNGESKPIQVSHHVDDQAGRDPVSRASIVKTSLPTASNAGSTGQFAAAQNTEFENPVRQRAKAQASIRISNAFVTPENSGAAVTENKTPSSSAFAGQLNSGSNKQTIRNEFVPPKTQAAVATTTPATIPESQDTSETSLVQKANGAGGAFSGAPDNSFDVGSQGKTGGVAVSGNQANEVANEIGETSRAKKVENRFAQPKTEFKFALRSKCPVSLITEGRWVDGDRRFGCTHRGRTYLFATQEALVKFQSDPDKYSPMMAGFDPVQFHETGKLIDGKEEHGVFMGKLPDQRVVLFSDAESRSRFQQNPQLYIQTVRRAMVEAEGNKLR